MPEPRRPSTRMVIIGGAVAVAIILVIIVLATRSDDPETTSSTTSTSALVIQSPATVTGITGVTGASDGPRVASSESASPSTEATNTYPLVHTLVASGTYDCTRPGSWQPFAEIRITVQVGEPAINATCPDTVLDLPVGFCSTGQCAAVPDSWRVDEQAGVSPQALMMIVAPTNATTNTAQFLCVKDFVPQPKQILPVATSIEDACLSGTSDSVDIPYVPPATSDIPYVPPPASVDIPVGTA